MADAFNKNVKWTYQSRSLQRAGRLDELADPYNVKFILQYWAVVNYSVDKKTNFS